MARSEGGFSARPFGLRLDVNTQQQDVAGNRSLINVQLSIFKISYSPSWSNNQSNWNATINGIARSGTFTFDFRNSDSMLLYAEDIWVSHNADGGKSFGVSASSNADSLGSASAGLTYTPATIPRATQPSTSSPLVQFGSSVTVNLPRASTGFTSTIKLTFGNASYTYVNKYGGNSYDITPPDSFMNQIPNADSGMGTVMVDTYSGNTLIGTKTVNLGLQIPSSIRPTFDDITVSEANSALAAAGVTGYVKSVSRLAYAITGASGIYGSTIRSYKFSIAGQNMTARTGTSGAIGSSGSVTGTATITDSRGRTGTKSVTINVLNYSPPKLNAVSLQRANGVGAPSVTDGTFARVNLNLAIASLKPGSTEQNAITYRVYSRVKGTTAWTLQDTSTPSGTSFSGYELVSGYGVEQSFEFRVEVSDKFSTSAVQLIMSAATIFMHWDGQLGVGINKFRERGALDVNGEIYNHQLSIVEPAGMVTAWAGGTGNSAPTGWLICNGGLVSRATYAGLFAAIGTTYGEGDGSTTFAVPNLKGRVIVGANTSDSTYGENGNTGGSKSSSHSHWQTVGRDNNSLWVAQGLTGSKVTTQARAQYNATTSTGTSRQDQTEETSVSLLQPFMALAYIIKA